MSSPSAAPALVHTPAWKRLVLSVSSGFVDGAIASRWTDWGFSLLVGWTCAAFTFLLLLWFAVHQFDAEETRSHAGREDGSRFATDVVLTVASVGSLFSVGMVLAGIGEHGTTAANVRLGLAVTSVIASWMIVHALFALKYARMYYTDDIGGFDFHCDDPPTYSDFSYVSFTVGMSFAISDTDVTSPAIRRLVLRQALLSYLFGAVIIAATINLVAGLAG